MGGSAPDQLDVVRRQADLLLGLAQRGLAQVLVRLVLAPAGERDLAGVPAQVRAALGEHGDQVVALEVERHQHGRVGGAAGRVEPRRLLGA